ncbi:MAG: hypothetical protein RLZ86_1989, partial [Actinomycetota bacterium]
MSGPRECDVQRPHPLRFAGDDTSRLDHHDGVELETLHETDRYDRDSAVERRAIGTTVVDSPGRQCLGHCVGHVVRGDHRDVPTADGVDEGERLVDRSIEQCARR